MSELEVWIEERMRISSELQSAVATADATRLVEAVQSAQNLQPPMVHGSSFSAAVAALNDHQARLVAEADGLIDEQPSPEEEALDQETRRLETVVQVLVRIFGGKRSRLEAAGFRQWQTAMEQIKTEKTVRVLVRIFGGKRSRYQAAGFRQWKVEVDKIVSEEQQRQERVVQVLVRIFGGKRSRLQAAGFRQWLLVTKDLNVVDRVRRSTKAQYSF